MRVKTRLIGHYLFVYGAGGIYLPFLPLFLVAAGLDSMQIGLLLAIGPSTGIIAQIVWGSLADKHNRRKEYLVIALMGTAAVCFAMTAFRSLSVLALLLFLYALFSAAIFPLTDCFALDIVTDSSQFGLFRRWGSLGFAVSALGGGVLFSCLPVELFGIVAGSLYGLTLAWTVSLPNPPTRTSPVQMVFPLGEVLRVPGVPVLLMVVLLVMIPYGVYSSFLGWHLQSLGASRLWVGVAWTLAAVSEVPVFGLGSRWLKRITARMLMVGAALVFAVRWFVYAYIHKLPIIVLLQASQGLSFALFYLAAVEVLTKLVPFELRSSAQSLLQSVGFGVGTIVGSAGGGWLLKQSGLVVLYLIMTGLSVLGALICFRFQATVEQKQ